MLWKSNGSFAAPAEHSSAAPLSGSGGQNVSAMQGSWETEQVLLHFLSTPSVTLVAAFAIFSRLPAFGHAPTVDPEMSESRHLATSFAYVLASFDEPLPMVPEHFDSTLLTS